MYPRSRNPGAATSKTGGSNLKNVLTIGTRYERTPRRCGIRLRICTTAGPNPKPTLLTNHSPKTRPASKRREPAVTHRLRGELLSVAGTLGARDVHRPPLRAERARDHRLGAPRGAPARRRIEYHMGMKHERQTRYNLVCRSRISGVSSSVYADR